MTGCHIKHRTTQTKVITYPNKEVLKMSSQPTSEKNNWQDEKKFTHTVRIREGEVSTTAQVYDFLLDIQHPDKQYCITVYHMPHIV